LGKARRLELPTEIFGAPELTRDVVADVGDAGSARLGRKQRVERRDSVRLRRGNGQPPADVVERAPADETDSALHLVERGKEKVALGTGVAETASHDVLFEGLTGERVLVGGSGHPIHCLALFSSRV
jgi:hypothetical protein